MEASSRRAQVHAGGDGRHRGLCPFRWSEQPAGSFARRYQVRARTFYDRNLSLKHLVPIALVPGLALAATTVLFDPLSPTTGPFPSDALTTPDPLQRTGLRLNLPVPDCVTTYTECQEMALLDQTDGFSLRPRIRVRFSGPVNTATLRDGIFIVGPSGTT